ncbi:MAG TPA: hypothetical protein VGN85_04120, partial [Methyloceanibacter sp.]|nr:hypothetical protein [Methyloceanibacter sp.]
LLLLRLLLFPIAPLLAFRHVVLLSPLSQSDLADGPSLYKDSMPIRAKSFSLLVPRARGMILYTRLLRPRTCSPESPNGVVVKKFDLEKQAAECVINAAMQIGVHLNKLVEASQRDSFAIR